MTETSDPAVVSTDSEATTDILTFLIADVCGYTRFTQERGDEAAARLATKFARLAREIVESRGGRVLELRGDEALAIFGSARQALRCAMELQARFARESTEEPELPLPAGVGLDAGEAVPVEGGYRGGALNLAARLCSLAGPGEILTTQTVAHLARKIDGLRYWERGLVDLKGFVEPVVVIDVMPEREGQQTDVREVAGGIRQPQLPIGNFLGALATGPLIGREEERERLVSLIDEVEQGNGQFIVLHGERGIGKTRLAQEVTLEARDRGFLVATGRCYERQQAVPFFPFVEALAAAYAAAPPGIQVQVPRRWPHLGRLLPEQAIVPPTPATDSQEEEYRLFRAVTGFLLALAEKKPMALLLDDLEWADTGSLDLLQHLARQTRGHRALLLGTYRDADVTREHPLERALRDLGRERLVERIAMRRLAPEATAALVATTMGQMEASEEFAEFVHRRTKGNPYFVDEMIRALGGRLRLIREIGAGGMGRVFEAIDARDGRRVAARIMFARGEIDLDALLRFQQEGAVLSTLKHPNIVEVYSAFMEEHASCIVMELLEGASLAHFLRLEDLSLERIKMLLQQVTASLAYAHSKGIIHRDIKPDNIMVVGDDHVKVADFGIARVLRPDGTINSLTGTGMAMGTPLYMAPEQIVEGQKVDGRADIYSLGAILYQIVTGRPPFEGSDPLTVAFKHVNEAPPPPTGLNGDVPKDWEALILKALAKDPAKRFQTAGEMGEAIARLSTGKVDAPARLRGWRIPTPTSRPARSRPAPSVIDQPATPVVAKIDVAHEAPAGVPHDEMAGPRAASENAARRLAGTAQSIESVRVYGLAAVGVAIVVIAALGALLFSRLHGSNIATVGSILLPVPDWGPRPPTVGKLRFPDGVAVDPQGHAYVADRLSNQIVKLSSSGELLAVWGKEGSARGEFSQPGAIAVGRAGNIYVADTNNNRVQELASDGTVRAVMGTSGPASAQLARPNGVTVDNGGNVYVSDTDHNRIVEFSPRGKEEEAFGSGGAGQGQLDGPEGIALDGHGHLYVVDGNNDRVEELSIHGDFIRAWGMAGLSAGRFNGPAGIAIDRFGNVYVADSQNYRIQEFSSTGTWRRSWGSQGNGAGQFASPVSVAVDPRGTIYIADEGNGRIQTFTGPGKPGRSWGERPMTASPLRQPIGLAVDSRGDIYVANTGRKQVAKLSPGGQILKQWGARLSGYDNLNAPWGVAVDRRFAIYVADAGSTRIVPLSPSGRSPGDFGGSSQFNAPYGVTVGRNGSVYVADTGNNRVVELSAGGALVNQWSGPGSGLGQFNFPYAVAVDSHGNMYVADSLNNRIDRLSAQGIWASWGTGGSGRGQFSGPSGVATDVAGNVYVADTGNNRAVKLSPSGTFLGRHGTEGSGVGQLRNPRGIAVDRAGNVYVADTDNNRIQKLIPAR